SFQLGIHQPLEQRRDLWCEDVALLRVPSQVADLRGQNLLCRDSLCVISRFLLLRRILFDLTLELDVVVEARVEVCEDRRVRASRRGGRFLYRRDRLWYG